MTILKRSEILFLSKYKHSDENNHFLFFGTHDRSVEVEAEDVLGRATQETTPQIPMSHHQAIVTVARWVPVVVVGILDTTKVIVMDMETVALREIQTEVMMVRQRDLRQGDRTDQEEGRTGIADEAGQDQGRFIRKIVK